MNNSNQNLTSREEFMRGMSWLYENDLDKFNFIEAVIKAIVNKEPISSEISSNKDTHTVTVSIGDCMYEEEFKSLEDAMVLVDMARSIKREVA